MASIQLTIEKLVEGGDGLARLDGKAVFVRQALPGETVLASIVEQKSDYCRAVVDQIIAPAPERVDPLCPYYADCGGCDLQHAATSAQTRWKEAACFENMRRIGGCDVSGDSELVVLPAATGPDWAYRTRARFHVDVAADKVGFLAAGSGKLIAIEECPVLSAGLNRLLAEKRSVLIKAAKMHKAMHGAQQRTAFIEVPAFEGDRGISLSNHVVTASVLNRSFSVDAQVFFQANRHVLPAMVEFVTSHAVGERVMDLYSGVGLFASFLQALGKSVVAVERDPRCLELARMNLTENVGFYSKSVEAYARSTTEHFDTVVADPPRGGLDPSVVDAIVSYKPQAIIYVSCNSVTLARDVKRFSKAGYRPKVLQMFDMYPQTSHIETVVLLSGGKSRQSYLH